MRLTRIYESPIGKLLMVADEEGLIGLWYDADKYFDANTASFDMNFFCEEDNNDPHMPRISHILDETKRWLDIYFSGENPDFIPPLHLIGTDFRIQVWEILLKIP